MRALLLALVLLAPLTSRAQPAPARMAAAASAAAAVPVTGPGVTGTLWRHAAFPSAFVAARTVDVWLPPGYSAASPRRYPVVYLHDGQNVFDPATSYTGVDWGADEAMTDLLAVRAIAPAILVGVWNTPARVAEYMPAKAVTGRGVVGSGTGATAEASALQSDAYLRFLVTELKPFVDAHYRTLPGRAHTSVMGSSMGGLVSLYAIAEHPRVFGGAAGVSTHWPAAGGAMVDFLARALPSPGTHRLYLDHGTATLDSLYAPYQARVDALVAARGYRAGVNWTTRRFDGAEHSERAWRARVHLPLLFLLGPPR